MLIMLKKLKSLDEYPASTISISKLKGADAMKIPVSNSRKKLNNSKTVYPKSDIT